MVPMPTLPPLSILTLSALVAEFKGVVSKVIYVPWAVLVKLCAAIIDIAALDKEGKAPPL